MPSILPGPVSDVDACVRLWLQALRHRDGSVLDGTDERTRRLFDEEPVRFAVADRPPRGFAVTVRRADRKRIALLARIAVRPHDAGRGIGRALLDDAVDASSAAGMEALELDVRSGNPAVRLYEAAGFRPVSGPFPHELGGAPMRRYRLSLPKRSPLRGSPSR